jgi:protein-histidine N-methyltransferase
VLQWHLQNPWSGQTKNALELAVADYNPSVLRLVTVPNLLLSWAQCRQSDWQDEGEMEIDEEVLTAFTSDLAASNIGIELFSGAWGEEFVRLVKAKMGDGEVEGPLTVIGTETIYSPFALQSFAEVLSRILGPKDGEGGEKETGKRKEKEKERDAVALVGAKMVYFGVGGSVEDFCEEVKRRGGSTEQIREETEGVRRTVMEVRWG